MVASLPRTKCSGFAEKEVLFATRRGGRAYRGCFMGGGGGGGKRR